MATHELKTTQPHFDAVADGAKRVEIRWNDRGFEVGDVLILREYDATKSALTGRYIEVRVTHILRGFEGLVKGWVALSFEPLQPSLFDAIARMF